MAGKDVRQKRSEQSKVLLSLLNGSKKMSQKVFLLWVLRDKDFTTQTRKNTGMSVIGQDQGCGRQLRRATLSDQEDSVCGRSMENDVIEIRQDSIMKELVFYSEEAFRLFVLGFLLLLLLLYFYSRESQEDFKQRRARII